jgi:hypothetical protein
MNMKRTSFLGLFTIILLVSCASSGPAITPLPLSIQYTFSTTPWLEKFFKCSGDRVINAELLPADLLDLDSSDLVMRISMPTEPITPAYQIGTDDLLVIINPQNPVSKLTVDQVFTLFTGRIQTWKSINNTNNPVHVWVFAAGEDVQQVFEQAVLGDSPVTSLARLANSPEEMLQAVSNDAGAVGLITRSWETKTTSDAFTVARSLPILAIPQSEPTGALAQILACLQK